MSVTWPIDTHIIAMGLKDELVALNDPEQQVMSINNTQK